VLFFIIQGRLLRLLTVFGPRVVFVCIDQADFGVKGRQSPDCPEFCRAFRNCLSLAPGKQKNKQK